MKRILLFSLAILVSGLATAQTLPVSNAERVFTVSTTNQNVPTISKNNTIRAIADTLFPAALTLECAEGPVVFSTNAGGFVFGTNEFFDFEKIQRLSLEESVNVTVSQVLVGFATADSAIINKPLAINIYNDLAADGSLGAVLGTSDTLLVGETAVFDTTTFFTTFTFSTPVELTGVSSFLVGVDISGVYFDATGALDTLGNIGIGSTDDGCGDGTNVLEIFPTQNGLAFNNVFANWQGLNAEMYVAAIVDRDIFSSNRTQNADFNASAFPNPVEGELNLSFDAPASGDYQIRVISAAGAVLSNKSLRAIGGNNRTSIEVTELPAGIYLFQVEGAAGIQTGRFVKR